MGAMNRYTEIKPPAVGVENGERERELLAIEIGKDQRVAFEWYYFDVHGQQDTDFVLTIHTRPFTSLFEVCIVDLFVYRNGRKWLHEFLVLPRNRLEKTERPLRIYFDEQNWLYQDGSQIRGEFGKPGIRLSFQFHSPLLQRRPVHLPLLPVATDAQQFDWVVFAPWGTATATIHWNGQVLTVEGAGYHDYNAGTVNFKRSIRHWFWAKFYMPHQLLIFGEIIDRHNRKRTVALLIEKERIRVDEHPEKSVENGVWRLDTTFGEFLFRPLKSHCVDAVSFYLPTVSPKLAGWGKFREVLQFYVTKWRLTFLQPLLANAKYLRFRTVWEHHGRRIQSFHEEMWL